MTLNFEKTFTMLIRDLVGMSDTCSPSNWTLLLSLRVFKQEYS